MTAVIEWVIDGKRRCCSCKEYKALDDFHKDKSGPADRAYSCKSCAIARARRHHHRRMKDDPSYKQMKKDNYLKSRWGLTEEEYDSSYKKQKTCAICGVLLIGGLQTHLDHDHKTGKIRKFLCTNCNRGLGSFHDSKEKLMKAISYLEEHSKEGTRLC